MIPGRVLDLFIPPRITQENAVFFIHGGGWRGGTRAIFHPIIRVMLEMGFVCCSTDYRLSGTLIGEQIMDVRHGYMLYLQKLAKLGRPSRVVVMGSSAGAHLALLLALAMPGECGDGLVFGDMTLRQEEWLVPAGAVVQAAPTIFEPWEEMFPPSYDAMREIVGSDYEEMPELFRRVSPIQYVRPSSPPVLLMDAANEHMFPLEHSQAFAQAMHQAGARAVVRRYRHAEHGFFYDVNRPVQQRALRDVLEFIASLSSPCK